MAEIPFRISCFPAESGEECGRCGMLSTRDVIWHWPCRFRTDRGADGQRTRAGNIERCGARGRQGTQKFSRGTAVVYRPAKCQPVKVEPCSEHAAHQTCDPEFIRHQQMGCNIEHIPSGTQTGAGPLVLVKVGQVVQEGVPLLLALRRWFRFGGIAPRGTDFIRC